MEPNLTSVFNVSLEDVMVVERKTKGSQADVPLVLTTLIAAVVRLRGCGCAPPHRRVGSRLDRRPCCAATRRKASSASRRSSRSSTPSTNWWAQASTPVDTMGNGRCLCAQFDSGNYELAGVTSPHVPASLLKVRRGSLPGVTRLELTARRRRTG
jgi:hypothetical protein